MIDSLGVTVTLRDVGDRKPLGKQVGNEVSKMSKAG